MENKSGLDQIKAELEALEVQLKLGQMEAKDHLAKQQKRLAQLVEEADQMIERLEDQGEEKIAEAHREAKELAALLDADFDFSYTDYQTHPQRVTAALNRFESTFQHFWDKADDQSEVIDAKLKEGLERFRLGLEVQQSFFQNQSEKAEEEFEEWKKERLEEVNALKSQLNEKWEDAEERLDHFKQEMGQALGHLWKAFGKK